jgi:hypothetical protein
MVTASIAAGCGGINPCTTDSPATIGNPTSTSDDPVRRATVKAIGISSTKPTSKKTGRPTTNPITTIAQWMFLGPNSRISVNAMRSAPPDSAIILPSMVPSPTTIAMCPSVLPRPTSNEWTIACTGIPVTTASASDVKNRTMKGFSLKTAMSRMSAITALSAATSRKTPWWSIIRASPPAVCRRCNRSRLCSQPPCWRPRTRAPADGRQSSAGRPR